ncbi:MAG: aspartate/glutamate racemase family protein [Gordonia sp. (in: high G+C Gram-positive bacteria)]|uniref:aspartate/glutamate racemase family protein n=1 Tax=Gordonia sp. (in: high G+C Gram-positive bacteria) TaxID=84139 RepID=UPI0039E29071
MTAPTPARKKITLVNPAANDALTAQIAATITSMEFADGPEIAVVTLPGGPHLMVSQENIDSVASPLVKLIEQDTDSDAFIVGCYADPGLKEARAAAAPRPVFGLNQCAIGTALATGSKVGVIAVQEVAVERHRKYYEEQGVADRIVGERAVEVDPELAKQGPTAFTPEMAAQAAIAAGTKLRDEDGADVVVLGEGGMSALRVPVSQALGLPVVDPSLATIAMATQAVQDFVPPAAN